MLLTLGIDSAFSLVEAGAASIIDKFRLKRIHVNIGFGIIAGVIGLIYTTQSGLYWLDIVDYFMNNYGLLVVGILQCFVVGYFYSHSDVHDYVKKHSHDRSIFSIPAKIVELRKYANSKSDFTIGVWWDFCVKYLTPVVVGLMPGLGKECLAGLLVGSLITGLMLGIQTANSGGAMDNAKKYIEEGNFGGKGSETHKAAVVGDTVGDPLKDTVGPSINILIKLMAVISLVIAPLLK